MQSAAVRSETVAKFTFSLGKIASLIDAHARCGSTRNPPLPPQTDERDAWTTRVGLAVDLARVRVGTEDDAGYGCVATCADLQWCSKDTDDDAQ